MTRSSGMKVYQKSEQDPLDSYNYQKDIDGIKELCSKYSIFLGEKWASVWSKGACQIYFKELQQKLKDIFEETITETKQREEDLLKMQNVLEAEEKRDSTSERSERLEDLEEKKKKYFYELKEAERYLCSELGEETAIDQEKILPENKDIIEAKKRINKLKTLKQTRLEKCKELKNSIKTHLDILQLNKNTTLNEPIFAENHIIKLDQDSLLSLEQMNDHYAKQVKEVETEISSMKEHLKILWIGLNTPCMIRKKFETYDDFSKSTFEIFKDEVMRCESLKAKNIKHYIQNLCTEINFWWQKTLKPEYEKKSVFDGECYNQDMAEFYEIELKELLDRYEDNKGLFLLVDQYIKMFEALQTEGKPKDSKLSWNRSSQVAKYDKEKKQIRQRLSKLEDHLIALAKESSLRKKKDFTVFGGTLEDFIETCRKRLQDVKSKAKPSNVPGEFYVKTSRQPSLASNSFLKESPNALTKNTKKEITAHTLYVKKNNGPKKTQSTNLIWHNAFHTPSG